MTCVLGLIDKGSVYIGADSAGIAGLSISIRNDPKVFGVADFIIGFTSSFRMGQLLRWKFSPPPQTVHQDDYEYMCTTFIDSVRECFARNGFGSEHTGGNFLVGYKSKLYNVQADYQVGIPSAPFDTAGCGADLALGALYATEGMNPEDRVKIALSAAAAFSAGVSAPFNILKLEPDPPPPSKPKAKAKPVVKKKR